MKIGITERGDAACSMLWVDKCKGHAVDGAIIITKKITDTVKDNLLALHAEGFPLILHATITGWGGTYMEPGVWEYEKSVRALKGLVDAGFPASRIIIRIDPMFPTQPGIRRVKELMRCLHGNGLFAEGNGIRLRMSIYDEYPHVRERLAGIGLQPMYGGCFSAPGHMVAALAEGIHEVREELGACPGTSVPVFETCAEDRLACRYRQDFRLAGCVSKTDLDVMGLECPEGLSENKQGRGGCHCLSVKTELLAERKPCPHKCIYCYWKDK